jgi:hypothetical protein
MDMASTVVRGDLLKSVEFVTKAPELASPISVVSNGFSNVPKEGLALAMVVSGESSKHGECIPKVDGGCGGFCFSNSGGSPRLN